MSLNTRSPALVLSNCSFYWSQQSLYLLKGPIVSSVKSERRALQKCRVQVRTGHFAICTQQTTSTSVSRNCVPTSDDRTVLGSQLFHPNLAPMGACTPSIIENKSLSYKQQTDFLACLKPECKVLYLSTLKTVGIYSCLPWRLCLLLLVTPDYLRCFSPPSHTGNTQASRWDHSVGEYLVKQEWF